VSAIILTHAHFDHIGAVAEVVAATGAPIYIHALDSRRLTSAEPGGTGGALFGFDHVSPPADRELEDGEVLQAGTLRLEVLHTPGHTAGGISLLATDSAGPPHLFSGDTLFAGSVGRTDFPAGDASALAHSIASKLAPLPAETIVHPGHGPETTVGREARINPFWPRA
jgi:glyoxylase-like metal-dependent hydrolase (beta-lactamase superfamily II)